MVTPWQRHLLTVERGEEEDGMGLSTDTLVVAAAVLVVLALLVLQCVCGDKRGYRLTKKNSSHTEEGAKKGASKKNGTSAGNSAMQADSSAVAVDIPADGENAQSSLTPGEATPGNNGVVHGARNGVSPSGHSRNASSGSGQMRPTSLRELPDLPVGNHKRNVSGAGGGDNLASARTNGDGKEDGSGYDHLGAKIAHNSGTATTYDHINLESPRDQSSGTTPLSEPDTASEGHYAQVRERTYDVVKDVRTRNSAKAATASDYDPYAKVKDVDDDKEDPYAKVKDTSKEEFDDGYAHLKNDHVLPMTDDKVPNNRTADEEEDPYEKVLGDSAGARVVHTTSDNTNIDDPYSMVSDPSSVMVVPMCVDGSPPSSNVTDTHGLNANNSSGAILGEDIGNALRLQYADEGDVQDDYATVVKDRNLSTADDRGGGGGGSVGGGMGGEDIDPYFTSPPEPPRLYGASEVGRLPGVGTVDGGEAGVDHGEELSSQNDSKEHRYTKVTARESLASMSARNALNPYEIVPDLPENTYATVDGGSGDGVVRYATPGTPNLQHSASELSETYAEIGASGSGSYAVPAPEPPSLDSLHSMTKSTSSNDGDHNGRAPASPSANPNVVIAEDGYAMVSKSSFSPSETALPQIPRAVTSSSVGSLGSLLGEEKVIGGVTIHPDYHSVKDCVPSDHDNENDPNYESVDEALSKVPASTGSSSALTFSGKPVRFTSTTTTTITNTTTITTATAPRVTIINHTTSPLRVRHQYEEVSPPASPLGSPSGQTPGRTILGGASAAASSARGTPINGTPSDGEVSEGSKGENSSGEAAGVRDRVLQGHMYEDISELKKRNSSMKEKESNVIHNVKL